jgi:hypothetical protein
MRRRARKVKPVNQIKFVILLSGYGGSCPYHIIAASTVLAEKFANECLVNFSGHS